MIHTAVVAEAVRPTWHATPLHPLLAATSGLILIAVVMSWVDAQASDSLGVATARALAGGFALGLDDEAESMLRSLPTGALNRLCHRLIVLVPTVVAAAATLIVADRLLVPGPSAMPSAMSVGALVATGVAVQIWWSRRWPDTAAEGAAVVVTAWALAGLLVPDVLFVHRFADAWHTQAPWVLGVSVVLVVTGAIGRRS